MPVDVLVTLNKPDLIYKESSFLNMSVNAQQAHSHTIKIADLSEYSHCKTLHFLTSLIQVVKIKLRVPTADKVSLCG